MNKLSFLGKKWNFLEYSNEKIVDIKQKVSVNELLIKILLNRGFKTALEMESFLDAKLKTVIPEPNLFLDMEKGVERIIKAINFDEKIMILGDYDVDGISSTCLLVKYLRILGVKNLNFYIPNRFSDGYGLSANMIQKAVDGKVDLIITLDSGVNSVNEVEVASLNNIDTIIIDHHVQIVETVPKCAAVINPNRKDQNEIEGSYIKNLCAAGVVFIFIMALQRSLDRIGFFKEKLKPDLLDLLDIVVLGTICDVMELKGINRALIKYFLKNNKVTSRGIISLMNQLGMEKINSPEDLSFFIGPALNAAGRLGDPHVALNLLLEDNESHSERIAQTLIELNKERKKIETEVLLESLFMIEENNFAENKGICVFADNWHEGVIGIIAGKLKDKFNKPSFVISIDPKTGLGKGSARSVSNFNLAAFFDEALQKQIIKSGGGHALAGGFVIEKQRISDFMDLINSQIEYIVENVLHVDYLLSHSSNLHQIYNDISNLEPFGKGLEKPLFCMKRLKLKFSKASSNKRHFLLNFSGEFGKGNVKGIIFNVSAKDELIRGIEQDFGALFDIVGTINSHPQFAESVIIEDIRHS